MKRTLRYRYRVGTYRYWYVFLDFRFLTVKYLLVEKLVKGAGSDHIKRPRSCLIHNNQVKCTG
jgi:hypothetical protein